MPEISDDKAVHKHIRITVVGDGTTGKTCLLICYKDKKFQQYYIPTVFDSYSMTVPIGNDKYTIILRDTAGQEEYDRLRPLAYPDTDVFVVCFAVDNRNSFRNVEKKWVPEIRHHKAHAKVILACTKVDLRNSEETNQVKTVEGLQMQKKLKVDRYVECSSKMMENVSKVFAEAIAANIFSSRTKKKSNNCVFL